MWSFGATTDHTNHVSYANVAALDAPTNLSVACWTRKLGLHAAANRNVWGQADAASVGWRVVNQATEEMGLRIDTTSYDATTVMTVDGLVHAFVAAESGNILYDNVDEGDVTSDTVAGSSYPMYIGAIGALTTGAAHQTGQCMAWDSTLSDADAGKFFTGNIGAGPPALASLQFWAKCVGTPPTNSEIPAGGAGTKSGTVTEVVHVSDTYYTVGGASMYWLIAQHWGTLIGLSGLFGSALKMENRGKLLHGIREAMGCHFYGEEYEHDILVDIAGRDRKIYGYAT